MRTLNLYRERQRERERERKRESWPNSVNRPRPRTVQGYLGTPLLEEF